LLVCAAVCQRSRANFSLYNYYPHCRYINNQVRATHQGVCHLNWPNVLVQAVAFQLCAVSAAGRYVELSPQNIVNCRHRSAGYLNQENEEFCTSFNRVKDIEYGLNLLVKQGVNSVAKNPYTSGGNGVRQRSPDSPRLRLRQRRLQGEQVGRDPHAQLRSSLRRAAHRPACGRFGCP